MTEQSQLPRWAVSGSKSRAHLWVTRERHGHEDYLLSACGCIFFEPHLSKPAEKQERCPECAGRKGAPTP